MVLTRNFLRRLVGIIEGKFGRDLRRRAVNYVYKQSSAEPGEGNVQFGFGAKEKAILRRARKKAVKDARRGKGVAWSIAANDAIRSAWATRRQRYGKSGRRSGEREGIKRLGQDWSRPT